LVNKLPEPPPSKPKVKRQEEPLVHVASDPNEPAARMWAEILEGKGIHSLIKSQDYRPAGAPSIVSEYEIQVLASEAKRAKQVLDSL
jgi:hypothetical protein